MNSPSGCGPFGCLLKLIGAIILIPVGLILLLALFVAGVYLFTLHPTAAGIEDYFTGPAVGCLQVNLNSEHAAIRELVQQFSDTIVKPRVERRTERLPAFMRSASGGISEFARRQILPRALPYAVHQVMYQPEDMARMRPVYAVSSRLPLPVLKSLNLTGAWLNRAPGRVVEELRLPSREHPIDIRALDHKFLATERNWILLADSVDYLRLALVDTARAPGRNRLRELHSALGPDTDAAFLFDNRNRALRVFLDALEMKVLMTVPPGDREVIAYLFGRALPFSDRIQSITSQGRLLTPDSLNGEARFVMDNEVAAFGFSTFLSFLRRFVVPELAKSHLTLDYEARVSAAEVIVEFKLEGTRPLILSYLKRTFH